MKRVGALAMALQGDREIVAERSFNAPRELVFERHSNPALVKRWLWGPKEWQQWQMAERQIDFRVGGRYRYVWRSATRGDMDMGGIYREIEAPARMLNSELFDQDWTEGEALNSVHFIAHSDRTLVRTIVAYSSEKSPRRRAEDRHARRLGAGLRPPRSAAR